MDVWKFFDITHREHIICNPMSLAKLEQLITLLSLKPGAPCLISPLERASFSSGLQSGTDK